MYVCAQTPRCLVFCWSGVRGGVGRVRQGAVRRLALPAVRARRGGRWRWERRDNPGLTSMGGARAGDWLPGGRRTGGDGHGGDGSWGSGERTTLVRARGRGGRAQPPWQLRRPLLSSPFFLFFRSLCPHAPLAVHGPRLTATQAGRPAAANPPPHLGRWAEAARRTTRRGNGHAAAN